MTERRSVSQVLFGYLPQQTVDVRGGVWKVEEWRGAINESNVDGQSLRREVCRVARPWQATGKDGDFVRDVELRGVEVRVNSLDRKLGVRLVPFPRVWFCRNCNRLHKSPEVRCKCGVVARKGQLQFVHYCDGCAELREPYYPTCPEHRDSCIRFPGTASGSEILFECPVCQRRLREGFGFPRSTCGSQMKVTVHRAASVYTPRSVVVVNPPSRARMQELDDAGGAPRALEWVLEGMRTGWVASGPPNVDVLRRQLLTQGLAPEVVDQMLAAAAAGGGIDLKAEKLDLHPAVRELAEEQALTIALATSGSRVRIEDLRARTPPNSRAAQRFGELYPLSIADAGVGQVEFIERFPVLSGHFGFTRGATEPGASFLSAFRDSRGHYVVYGGITETEALYVGLSPGRVAKWLEARGHRLTVHSDPRSARLAILRAAGDSQDIDSNPILDDVTGLVHSYAHRLIRLAAVHAGIERNALSELLVPAHLGFFVYATARGDFVLGGLQALFENDLANLLHDFVYGEHRCALDPGCTRGGGACVACLHLGEPSCRLFNRQLDRAMLIGPDGYLRQEREW